MKKFILIPVLFILTFVIVLTISTSSQQVTIDSEENYISKYAWMSKEEWDSIDSSQSRYSTPEELLIEVDYYVEEIYKKISRENWIEELKSHSKKDFKACIKVEFTYDRISRAAGGGATLTENYINPVIKLSREKFESSRDDIVHELTHIISPYSYSDSMNEGLACYMQDIISLSNTSFQTELKNIEIEHVNKEHNYINEYLGNSENGFNKFQTSNYLERNLFYAFSDSFTHYLIDNYGVEKFMKLYSSSLDYDSYIEIIGADRDQLIIDWMNDVSTNN